MHSNQLQVGEYYLRDQSGLQMIRQLIAITNESVEYKFIQGYKKSLLSKTGHCSIFKFANWSQRVVRKEDLHLYQGIRLNPEIIVLDSDDNHVLTLEFHLAHDYLQKGKLDSVSEYVMRTNDRSLFINRIKELYSGSIPAYLKQSKFKQCVVCGIDHNLTKHHVIPKRHITQISEEDKNFLSNVLAICRSCHDTYENNVHNQEPDQIDSIQSWEKHFLDTMSPKFLSPFWSLDLRTIRN